MQNISPGDTGMLSGFLKFSFGLRRLLLQEEGQDLVEYALVVGLISISAVVGLHGVASAVNNVITKITTVLNSAV
jgi:pilus assembly protein Flp/PilA